MVQKKTVYASLFGIITLVLICVIGAQARVAPQFGGYWIVGLMLVLCLIIAIGWQRRWRCSVETDFPVYSAVLLFYALIIVLVGSIHFAGLAMIPGEMEINQFNVHAFNAMKQERAFALYYLLFPAMVLTQIELQRVVSLQAVIRCLFFAGLLTAIVSIYQVFFDSTFLHAMSWGERYEGLATDPNALALPCFLLVPLLAIGCWIEKLSIIRLFYLLLILMLGIAVWGTGNRTGFVGICLLLLSFPWVLSVAMNHWSLRRRLMLGLLPVAVCFAGLIFASSMMTVVENTGLTGERLAGTWKKFEAQGIHGVFFQEEHRGRYLVTGIDLVSEAPWAGWGPAGFYREATNMFYLRHGWRGDFRDSALNHYLMIASDFGLPAMAINLAILFSPVALGIVVFRRVCDVRPRLILAALISSNLLFLLLVFTIPPSYFLGAVWLWSVHLVVLLMLARQHGVALRFPQSSTIRRAIMASAILLTLIVLAGSYETSFGDHGYAVRAQHAWWKSG